MTAKINIGTYIWAGLVKPLVCKVNNKETSITPEFDKLAVFNGTGLLNLVVIEGENKIEGMGFIFDRGWGQPDGIRMDEAIRVGKQIGNYLKQKDISKYEILENPHLLANETPWDIGNLSDYKLGISLGR